MPSDRLLLQEIHRNDPWKLLVSCVLLNITNRDQVDGVVNELFTLWSSPQEMAKARKEELAEAIRPCGLQNRRAEVLIELSRAYLSLIRDLRSSWPPSLEEVAQMPGVGPYALDSYSTFVLNKPRNRSGDKEIRAWMLREVSRASQEGGIY